MTTKSLTITTKKKMGQQEAGNIEKQVELRLDEANGKATAQAISTFGEVKQQCERVFNLLLARGVSESSMSGVSFRHRPAGPTASSYNYSSISTEICCKKVADGWRLVACGRVTLYPKQREKLSIEITESARRAIMKKAFQHIECPDDSL